MVVSQYEPMEFADSQHEPIQLHGKSLSVAESPKSARLSGMFNVIFATRPTLSKVTAGLATEADWAIAVDTSFLVAKGANIDFMNLNGF